MAITLERLMAQHQVGVQHPYAERDTMLYGLAVGMGHDPLDETELDFIYERRGTLRTVPTMAVTLARHNLIFEIGMQVEKFLHGEQIVTFHRPLPKEGVAVSNHRIKAVHDKGPVKGLLVEAETNATLADGTPLFDIYNLYFCRGDGGIGSSGGTPRPPYVMPTRVPDLVRTFHTEKRQALIYRLTGDRNVIHADPKVAREVGFQRPILHGSGTMGIACREVLAGVLNYDNTRMLNFGTRFTSVVYPGDTIETQIWVDGDQVSFRCRVPERDVTALDCGQCRIVPA